MMAKSIFIKKSGYSLFTLVLIMSLISFGIAFGVAVIKTVISVKADRDMAMLTKLENISRAVIEFYDIHGYFPSTLSEVCPPYTSILNPEVDDWGNIIVSSSISGGVVVVSSGRNGYLESLISGDGNFTPGGDDLFTFINYSNKRDTKREQTYYSLLKTNNEGLTLYLASEIDTQECSTSTLDSCRCVIDLVRKGYIAAKTAYDYWGRCYLLVQRNNQLELISVGPDGVKDTSDDVVTGRVTSGGDPPVPPQPQPCPSYCYTKKGKIKKKPKCRELCGS